MANKMLIDASHPEETRVVVVRGQKVEEFDFESATRKQLRGNIYLAKVTRVEPSLQAAFVEYGGNRHGFLAFSEIHPDYYQIPTADRLALIEDEARAERDEERDEERRNRRKVRTRSSEKSAEDGETASADDNGDAGADDEDAVEQLGGDALEEMPERPRQSRRQYKIQEVIKRRQILLVQVVKEERGNKGAALTTYLSLAGRYSVLMPNTARGGGISRKITSAEDRKRLKAIAQDLDVPQGMGVILRTAGASRTKAEVKRDFEYLMRLWESVRELTLSSSAPALVYEEGSLIKRAIRDLYNKDIDEVLVSGDDSYREAKDFMRMLMPSHAKVVKAYREPTPLFARFGVEQQLDAMFSNQVSLKSGGYLVINPTEALVSIDVNSGRSTREHNIEDTALKTNLEAADEVARQLRLRDLAGLIVIDFIDMEEKRNNRAVEKRLKDALKTDRARIQIGRISAFGLMEMSRQRIRTGVLESSSVICPTCAGSGFVRATPSVALHVLRSVEEQLIRSATHNLTVRTHFAVAFYILNQKRVHLRELEERFGVAVTVLVDETLTGSVSFAVDRGEPALKIEGKGPATGIRAEAIEPPAAPEPEEPEEIEESAEDDEEEAPRSEARAADQGQNGEANGRRRRRRRRRRGRGGEMRDGETREFGNGSGEGESAGGRDGDEAEVEDQTGTEETSDDLVIAEALADGDAAPHAAPETAPVATERDSRRRRSRRGGRRDRSDETVSAEADANAEATPSVVAIPIRESGEEAAAAQEPAEQSSTDAKPAKAPRRRRTRKADAEAAVESAAAAAPEPVAETPAAAVEAEAAPAAESLPAPALEIQDAEVQPAATAEPEAEPVAAVPAEPVTVVLTPPDPDRPKRAGWWSKAKQVLTGQE